MKKHLNLFVLLILVVGCDKETSDSSKVPSDEYTLSSDVIEIQKNLFEQIMKIEDNTIYLAPSFPEQYIPEEGQVIMANEVSELIPYGFLGRVKSVSKSGSGYAVEIEDVPISEALSRLFERPGNISRVSGFFRLAGESLFGIFAHGRTGPDVL